MKSPLFEVFGSDAKAIRVTYQEPKVETAELSPYELAKLFQSGKPIEAVAAPVSRLKIELEEDIWDKAVPVESLEVAEQLVLDLVPVEDIEFHEDQQVCGCSGHHLSQIPLMMNRKANLIAARTRRAAGNVVLVGSEIAELLSNKEWISAFNASTEEEFLGRWKKIGVVNGCMVVYSSDAIPANEVFVAYVGSPQAIDGPAGLLVYGDAFRLHTLQNIETAMGNATDYVSRFRVKRVS